MAKKRKIPTHAEVQAKIKEREEQRLAMEKEQMIKFLQQKTLKVLFTFQVGLEAMDFLVPTEFYQKGKDMKLHGNRFVKALEREVEGRVDGLYKHDPQFTTAMFSQVEQMMEKMAKVDFADFPMLNAMLDAFLEDKENWRQVLKVQMARLDSDLTQE